MIKEVQFSGYSSEPSDYECADGQLAASLNLINEDHQLKPLFQPATLATLYPGVRIVFIHKNADYTHYIALYSKVSTTTETSETSDTTETSETSDTTETSETSDTTETSETSDTTETTETTDTTDSSDTTDSTDSTDSATSATSSSEATDPLGDMVYYTSLPTIPKPDSPLIETLNGTFRQCSAVGNVLIVLTDKEQRFFLWRPKTGKYEDLGTSLPELEVDFTTQGYFSASGTLMAKSKCVKVDGTKAKAANTKTDDGEVIGSGEETLREAVPARMVAAPFNSLAVKINDYFDTWPSSSLEVGYVKDDASASSTDGKNYPALFTNQCFALLNGVLADAKKQGLMVMPRLIRAAWRLYDGTYARFTQPVLLFNFGTHGDTTLKGQHEDSGSGSLAAQVYPYTVDYFLKTDMASVKEKWADIIKGVTFFMSSDVFDYDQQGQVRALQRDATTEVEYTSSVEQDGSGGGTYTVGNTTYHAVLPRPNEADQVKAVAGVATFFRAWDEDVEDVFQSSASEYAEASEYVLININRVLKDADTYQKVGTHTITITFNSSNISPDNPDLQKNYAAVAVNIYSGDSLELIYERAKAAIESTITGAQVHRMFLTRERSKKKILNGRLCIAVWMKNGNALEVYEVKAADESLNVYAINAHGRPLPSDRLPLSTLEAQTAVSDDYLQHVDIVPNYIRAYNKRLAMANLTLAHTGICPSLNIVAGEGTPDATTGEYTTAASGLRIGRMYFFLRTDEGNIITRTNTSGSQTLFNTCLHYLYYPDTRCYRAIVEVADSSTGGITQWLTLEMKPSDTLHGSVFIEKIPYWETQAQQTSDSDTSYSLTYILSAHFKNELSACLSSSAPADLGDVTNTDATFPTYDVDNTVNTGVEHRRNVVLVSYPLNPFNWAASSVTEVSTATVLALCPNTMALEQEQFGKNPLYAFTDTEGVWGLSVGDDGQFIAAQPVTRDSLLSADSLLQLDSSILFATPRGIMQLSGRDCQCITDAIASEAPFDILSLPGADRLHALLGHSSDACLPVRPFLSFLADCRMLYDYLHQRIILFNPTLQDDAPLYTYAYVYSLKSRLWGMMYSNLASCVNSYPDALAMTRDHRLVSFSSTDQDECHALYITRPLKLDSPDVLKTVITLIQRGHFLRHDVATALYASRDLYTWFLLSSSTDHYLRFFRGTPYKYFRIAGLATLTDGKSLFGASVEFLPRQTSQLR